MIVLDLISSLCINNQYVTELTNFETFITTRSYPMVPKTKKALSPYAAASYSPALHCSTIGASGLNFSVRNGKRWDPAAIAT